MGRANGVRMSWVKLDDGFPSHPKVLGLSDKAFRAYVIALCYAARHLTDGFLPPSVISVRQAGELHKAGLLDEAGGGWWLHDYLTYNPSRTEVESKSDSARHASRMRWASDADKERTRGRVGDRKTKEHPRFDAFYDAFPRRVGRIAAAAAFAKAAEGGADPEAIVAGAAAYRDDPTREAKFTAHPATWLNQGRWMDEATTKAPAAKSDPAYVKGTREWDERVQAEEQAAIEAMS